MKSWKNELDTPEEYTAIYLTESAVKSLRYALSHITKDYTTFISLSEAIKLLSDKAIAGLNLEIQTKQGKLVRKVDAGVWDGSDIQPENRSLQGNRIYNPGPVDPTEEY